MKYVMETKGRNGEVYLYLRKKGLPLIKLVNPMPQKGQEDGSPLDLEVRGLIAGHTAPKARKGTLREALRAYETEDPDFLGLAASTKALYRIALKEFDEDLGDLQTSAFSARFLLDLRKAWARQGYRAANIRLQVLKNVLKPVLIADGATSDPFSLIEGVRRPSDKLEPHIIWPEIVVETVIRAAIEEERFGLARAVAIMRYVGARRGDAVTIPIAARQSGQFRYLSGKRKVPVDVPEDEKLTFWLAATPAAQPKKDWKLKEERRTGVVQLPPRTLVYSFRTYKKSGSSRYTGSGLQQELGNIVARLFKEGRIDSDRYDSHGLRHTRGVEIALAGATDAQGAAMMGHSSPNSFAQYRRQADRLRMSRDGQALIDAMRLGQTRNPLAGEVQNGVQKK